MPENDWVGHLHHGCLQVHGKQHTFGFCLGNFGSEKIAQSGGSHKGRIDHGPRQQIKSVFQNLDVASLIHKFNFRFPGLSCSYCCRHFIGSEIITRHRGHMGFG